MIEEALKKSNEPPSETARALLSFFRQEFPHGGEYRFIQFFPLLLDRAFGPVLHDALLKEREFSSEELKMMESAWLMQSRAWRRSMTSSSSQGGNMNMGMHNSTSSSASRLDQDPVVQLLGSPLISQSVRSTTSSLTSKAALGSRGIGSPTPSASPVKTVSFFQLLNCCIDHPLSSNMQDEIIDTEYSFDLQVIPKARSSYPFSELPESLQAALIQYTVKFNNGSAQVPGSPRGTLSPSRMRFVEENTVQTQGDELLHLLSIKPIHQKELLQNLRQAISMKQYSLMNPGVAGTNQSSMNSMSQTPMNNGIFSPTQMHRQQRSPLSNIMSPNQTQPINNSASQKPAAQPQSFNIQLSLWEHYFITFVRFPMTFAKLSNFYKRQSGNNPSSASYNKSRAMNTSYGEKVFQFLLKDAMSFYFPHKYQVAKDTFGNVIPLSMSIKSEALLRFMMEFWLQRHYYASTKDAIGFLGNESSEKGIEFVSSLDASYDLAQLLFVEDKWLVQNNPVMNDNHVNRIQQRQMYEAPPRQVQRCIRSLVEHLISDPMIMSQCRVSVKDSRAGSTANDEMKQWVLPPLQTSFQTSLYNYIRTALRYGPVHVNNSSFYAAMDLWLMWLEPWNVIHRKKAGTATSAILNSVSQMSGPSTPKKNVPQMTSSYATPKPNHQSKYKQEWESYVASNLHFYLVPLAIFLRRAREFDFGKTEFNKSMVYVQRVIRVFSPQLVATIDKLLDIPSQGQNLKTIVEKHEQILGEFCPMRSKDGENGKIWNLDMLKDNMHNLLEEIVIQHRKTMGEQDIFERIGSRLEGLFGEGAVGEEAVITKLISKCKVIVKFPKDYEPIPEINKAKSKGFFRGFSNLTDSDNVHDSSTYLAPEREASGFITQKGKEQILNGSRICSSMDVSILGDPMYSRVKSTEIEALVRWSLQLSNKLNVYFKLDTPRPCRLHGEKTTTENLVKETEDMKKIGVFRFNLRAIADYRNWAMIYFTWKFLCWKFLK
ncbi:hypothetical protein CTEN210_01594 [Chaetoceros tenuissimus]|uniref:Uncharacterized protein n=1 Tax=Chaetoceros tenuissimus TaxID=426638 RepID=A0AAD3CI95_9STRA|nr:hypothetical protein CTEN210_01594 [Chaetoceros tenuissimus]